MNIFLSLFLSMIVAGNAAPRKAPPALVGCWKVSKILTTTNISGMSQEQAEQIIGTRIIYENSYAQSNNLKLERPGYVVTKLSDRDFFQKFSYIPLRQIGILGSSTTLVTLTAAEQSHSRFIGDTVFLGGRTPVIEVEGVFFKLERNMPCKHKHVVQK